MTEQERVGAALVGVRGEDKRRAYAAWRAKERRETWIGLAVAFGLTALLIGPAVGGVLPRSSYATSRGGGRRGGAAGAV